VSPLVPQLRQVEYERRRVPNLDRHLGHPDDEGGVRSSGRSVPILSDELGDQGIAERVPAGRFQPELMPEARLLLDPHRPEFHRDHPRRPSLSNDSVQQTPAASRTFMGRPRWRPASAATTGSAGLATLTPSRSAPTTPPTSGRKPARLGCMTGTRTAT